MCDICNKVVGAFLYTLIAPRDRVVWIEKLIPLICYQDIKHFVPEQSFCSKCIG